MKSKLRTHKQILEDQDRIIEEMDKEHCLCYPKYDSEGFKICVHNQPKKEQIPHFKCCYDCPWHHCPNNPEPKTEGRETGQNDWEEEFLSEFSWITSTRFWLKRIEDVSGVSGTGVVADGVSFPDGTCILRWRTAGGSTGVYESVEKMIEIHGHDGRTVVEYLNEDQKVKSFISQTLKAEREASRKEIIKNIKPALDDFYSCVEIFKKHKMPQTAKEMKENLDFIVNELDNTK